MTDFNRRVGDGIDIPPMNGTLADLVALIGTPLDSPEKQAQAIREIAILQLHSYLMHKQNRDDLNALLKERKGIIDKLVDKGLAPLLFMMFLAVLALLFKTVVPAP